MKVPVGELFDAFGVIHNLIDQMTRTNLEIKTIYKIRYNLDLISKDSGVRAFAESREAILDRVAEKDKGGGHKIKRDTPAWVTFVEEITKINETPVALDFKMLSIEEIGDLKLNWGELQSISFMIEELQDD